MPVLVQEDWDGAEDSAFLRSSQAAPFLLTQEAHFEWKSSMPSLACRRHARLHGRFKGLSKTTEHVLPFPRPPL